jgi:hypothetical protein
VVGTALILSGLRKELIAMVIGELEAAISSKALFTSLKKLSLNLNLNLNVLLSVVCLARMLKICRLLWHLPDI